MKGSEAIEYNVLKVNERNKTNANNNSVLRKKAHCLYIPSSLISLTTHVLLL